MAETITPPQPTAPSSSPMTPVTQTTRRGIATASVSLGMWGLLVFWWYPFGMMIASVGFTLGLIAVLMGFRVGKDGEHLAYVGMGLGFIAINLAVASYRFMQIAFEGSPTMPAFLEIAWPF